MASVRSLLAKWLGGAGKEPQAATRSLLARWLGGAGAIPPGGVRSLLARWLGGAGTQGLSQGGLIGGGSADVARTRSYEGPGGGVFDGSAIVTQISGAQDFSVVVAFPAPLRPEAKPVAEPERKRRVRQTYTYGPSGGLELSGSAIVSRSRAILASGGLALSAEYTVSRARSAGGLSAFSISGSADIETYDAIYDTEDEEIAMLMAFAA